MTEINRRDTGWFEMKPDVYNGPDCDQHKPQWDGFMEGDMDGDVSDTIVLDSKQFPPGTKVVISEPECPNCGCVPYKRGDKWKCECDFDWKKFADDRYS